MVTSKYAQSTLLLIHKHLKNVNFLGLICSYVKYSNEIFVENGFVPRVEKYQKIPSATCLFECLDESRITMTQIYSLRFLIIIQREVLRFTPVSFKFTLK